MDRLLFLQPGGVRVPVKLEIFKHGGGLYLAAVNHELGIHVPFVATATVMAAELRQALALVEGANAINDQGHISRAGNGNAPRIAPGAPNWDWLTPEMVIEYFNQSNVLRAMADDVRQVLKYQILESELPQLARDLADVRAADHPDLFKKNGKPNQTVIADILRIPNGGSSNYKRIQEVSTSLEKERRNSPISTAIKEPGYGGESGKARRRAA
jgi:hypothetical protein